MTLPEPTDRALADRVLSAREEAAFRALYRRHTPPLYRLALRLGGGDEPWAEEVVQRTWVRAVEGLAGFAWRAALRTWLSGIAVNCARELWREGRHAFDLDSAGEAKVVAELRPDPGDRVDLERAIAALPPGARRVLVLHDVEGFTHEEIAEMLGIEPGTSKSQLFHARRRMREQLDRPGSRIERRGNG